jgi:hypothetical protein
MSPKTAVRWVATNMAAFSLVFLPGPWLLRFSSETLNCWFMAVTAFSVPVSLLALGWVAQSTWRKAMAITLAVTTALPLGLLGLIALLESIDATASFRPIAELQADGHTYRLYQTDCGATCAFGLVLQREIEFLHVIKVVVPLWVKDHESDATLTAMPDGDVAVVRGGTVLFTTRSPH